MWETPRDPFACSCSPPATCPEKAASKTLIQTNNSHLYYDIKNSRIFALGK